MGKHQNSLLKPLPSSADSVGPWVERLRQAMYDAVGESDIKEIVENLVKKAKGGDAGAIKMLFDYVLGGRQNIQTQNNLVVTPSVPAPVRTDARAGSRRKLAIMQDRVANGYAPCRRDDGPEDDE